MSRTGVDLVISGRDESGPIFGQFERRLREAQGSVAAAGQRISSDFAGKFGGAIAGLMGVRAIDAALREFKSKLDEGMDMTSAGIAAAESFAKGLQSFPIAGVVGGWLAEAFDSVGVLAAERAQQASRIVAERNREDEATTDRFIARLRADAITESQRRRAEFSREVDPFLNRIQDEGSRGRIRADLEREYEAREERIHGRETQERLRRAREAGAGRLREFGDEVARLRRDSMTEEQQRRADFERSMELVLKPYEGTEDFEASREMLEREFDAKERRLRQRAQEAEEEQRRANETRTRERLELEAARERERIEQDRLKRLEQLRQAEERLLGAVDRGTVSERALMFANDRNARVSGPVAAAVAAQAPSATVTVELQKRSNEALEEIETYQRDALVALRDLVDRFPDSVETF